MISHTTRTSFVGFHKSDFVPSHIRSRHAPQAEIRTQYGCHAMPIVLWLFGVPLACALAWLVLAVRGPRDGVITAALAAAATAAFGLWSIAQSRSSTAGIGMLFVPLWASLAGSAGWAFGRFHRHRDRSTRVAAAIAGAVGLAIVAAMIGGGVRERAKNRDRDRLQADYSRKFDENRQIIKQLLRDNPGHDDLLDVEIDRHRDDRTFLIPALETMFVSEDRLDELSRSPDLGIVNSVARNRRARPDTLARIFRMGSTPFYFYQALAENRNTPADVLRSLAAHPEPMAPLDRSLAQNASTPRDILERIADGSDASALRALLNHPTADCALVRKTVASLQRVDAASHETLRLQTAAREAELCR
jgi:hypothetical protein